MDTLDFLQRVLPTEGKYCAWTKTRHGVRQRFFDTVEELAGEVRDRDHREQNTFFAISTFEDDGSRKKSNVRATKVVAIDIDCGQDKPFANWKDGLQAFGKFAKRLSLPKPLIVKSGNGLHVYWVLERALPREEWSALAHAMKDAATGENFEIDAGPTANPSLVLRPVGTHNWKDPDNPKAVGVLIDGGDTTVDTLKKALAYYYKPAQHKPKNNGLLDSLAVQSEFPPAVASVVASKCQQIDWAINHQDQVPEPLWYCLIGVAAHTTEPEDTAKRWSENHPGYSESETLKKLRQWKAQDIGPTTCAKIESERPAGCKGCPFAGQIGSPARLGVQYEAASAPPEDAPEEIKATVEIPKPFKHIKDGSGMAIHIDDTDTKICDFNIYPLSYGYDEALGYEVAQFMWDRPHVGWRVLTIRQAYLTDVAAREFTGAIADQGIVLETRKQTEFFHIMLRSYINELRKMKTVTNLYSTMGWKEDYNVFVLGDTLFRRNDDGTVTEETIRLSAHNQRVGSDMFTTSGSFETWKAGAALLEKGKLRAHQFSLGIGLASILYEFTGLKGVTVSLYGESGGGKSLAQIQQQSVWGNPEKLHMQSKFTQNSLFARFATHGNLPMTVDEATQMSDKDVADYLYSVSQGRDKARLDKNAAERAPREWALSSTLSTNKPLASKLLTEGNEMGAQLARLLELKVDVSPLFSDSTDFGRKVHRLFTTNYGWAGRLFLAELMKLGEQGIRAMIAEAQERFQKRYGKAFTGVERYWEQAFVLTDLALRLAYKWGIIPFKPEACINWALAQVDDMRDTIADNQRDLFDLVAEYINEHASEMVRVFHSPNSKPLPEYERLPRGTIRVRIDAHRAAGANTITSGTLLLDRTHFRRWFAGRGENPRELMATLRAQGADATPKTQKASLGKHTPISLPQSYVIGIDLTHPRMSGILDEVEEARKDAEVRQMAEVVSLDVKRGQ